MRGAQHPSRVPGSTARATGGDVEPQASDKRTRAEQWKQQKQQQRSDAEQVIKDGQIDQKIEWVKAATDIDIQVDILNEASFTTEGWEEFYKSVQNNEITKKKVIYSFQRQTGK